LWKTEHRNIVVTQDVILRSVSRCPLTETRESWAWQTNGDVEIVRVWVDKLWPYTCVSAAVMVMNSAHHGPPSAVVSFHTDHDGMLLHALCLSVCLSVCDYQHIYN